MTDITLGATSTYRFYTDSAGNEYYCIPGSSTTVSGTVTISSGYTARAVLVGGGGGTSTTPSPYSGGGGSGGFCYVPQILPTTYTYSIGVGGQVDSIDGGTTTLSNSAYSALGGLCGLSGSEIGGGGGGGGGNAGGGANFANNLGGGGGGGGDISGNIGESGTSPTGGAGFNGGGGGGGFGGNAGATKSGGGGAVAIWGGVSNNGFDGDAGGAGGGGGGVAANNSYPGGGGAGYWGGRAGTGADPDSTPRGGSGYGGGGADGLFANAGLGGGGGGFDARILYIYANNLTSGFNWSSAALNTAITTNGDVTAPFLSGTFVDSTSTTRPVVRSAAGQSGNPGAIFFVLQPSGGPPTTTTTTMTVYVPAHRNTDRSGSNYTTRLRRKAASHGPIPVIQPNVGAQKAMDNKVGRNMGPKYLQ